MLQAEKLHDLAVELAPQATINVVAINSAIPMCKMHQSCGPNSYDYDNWIKPMKEGTQTLTLQDDAEVDFWRQVGYGLQFHDDLVVYDRCGNLFEHLCTGGMMGTCKHIQGEGGEGGVNLLDAGGYAKLRAVALEAAKSEGAGCPCPAADRASGGETGDAVDSGEPTDAVEPAPWAVGPAAQEEATEAPTMATEAAPPTPVDEAAKEHGPTTAGKLLDAGDCAKILSVPPGVSEDYVGQQGVIQIKDSVVGYSIKFEDEEIHYFLEDRLDYCEPVSSYRNVSLVALLLIGCGVCARFRGACRAQGTSFDVENPPGTTKYGLAE